MPSTLEIFEVASAITNAYLKEKFEHVDPTKNPTLGGDGYSYGYVTRTLRGMVGEILDRLKAAPLLVPYSHKIYLGNGFNAAVDGLLKGDAMNFSRWLASYVHNEVLS